MNNNDKRPQLDKNISPKDFREFYWLKSDLLQFCRMHKLGTTGSKQELATRIATFLETGKKPDARKNKAATHSKFDWNKEKLSRETIITDNYKNSQNVRAFFEEQIGKSFKFKVDFMNWMKSNTGKTLDDAVLQWKLLQAAAKKDTRPKDIAPQFEYNTYLRDFLASNPGATRAQGIRLWKIKKSMRGPNKYESSDLHLDQR